MSEFVWVQYATLRLAGDAWRAESGIRRRDASEVSHDSDACSRSPAEAWSACEAALRRMAAECIREADECRNRSEQARRMEVVRGVA